jgi:predicted Zn finger-like uncharacterized protein
MIVECAQCQTKFKIADEKITPKGVKVRCSKCKHMFVVKPDGVEAAVQKPAEKPAEKPTEKPPKEKAEGIPDDIFRAPTRVESRPPTFPPGKKFPLPPPPMPAKAGPSLADKIDLDSDSSIPLSPKLSDPPLDQMPTMPSKPSAKAAAPPPPPAPPSQPPPSPDAPTAKVKPPAPSGAPKGAPKTSTADAAAEPAAKPAAASKKSDLGDALFSDLALDAPAEPAPKGTPKGAPKISTTDAAAEPATKTAAAKPAEKKAPAPIDDDPFAGIDVSAPPAPAAEQPPPWAAPKGAAKTAAAPPAGSDPVSGEAVGKPTKDLFDDLGDPFAGIPSTGADVKQPAGQELLPHGESELPAELAGSSPPTEDVLEGTPKDMPPPAPPAAKPSAPGRPQDDIFANIDSAPAEAGGTPSPAEADDDPFAGIDTSVPSGAPAAGAPDSLIGDDDPFAQMDAAAPAGMPGADEGEGPMSSGLELDAEGQLTGEPLPEPPPPTKAAPVQESKPAPAQPRPAAAPPMPMAGPEPDKTPPSGVLWAYKIGFGLLALVVVLLLFVAYRSGGKPDLTSWSTYVRAFTGDEGVEEVAGDLEVVGVKNTAYRTRDGHPLLVVWGQVSNKTKDQKAAVVVSGQLLDEKGEELGKFAAPAGVTFTPQEVFEMTDHLAVASAYHSRLEKILDLKVPPEGSVPFMLVFYDHPEEMEDMRIRVLPEESQDPLRGLPPEPEPTEDEEGLTKEDKGKPPASSAGVVVKKKGTIVRLKPKGGKPKPEPKPELEDEDDIPVEVVEEDVDEVEETP